MSVCILFRYRDEDGGHGGASAIVATGTMEHCLRQSLRYPHDPAYAVEITEVDGERYRTSWRRDTEWRHDTWREGEGPAADQGPVPG